MLGFDILKTDDMQKDKFMIIVVRLCNISRTLLKTISFVSFSSCMQACIWSSSPFLQVALREQR